MKATFAFPNSALPDKFMRVLLLSVALCTTFLAHATVYYISSAGNDTHTGTTPATAWRTIDRLNQDTYSIVAGDQVLFERGGTYRGTISVAAYGTASAPVMIGAYGTGAAPVISGSMLVTDWSQYSGNIWRAYIGMGLDVKYLFMNDQLMTLARYPNTGWLRNDQGTSTSLHDAELTQPNGYWTGATLVVRASNWNYDRATVSGSSQGTLSFPTIYDYLGNNDWGYYLCNKLSELDQPGEWYYDTASGMLYFQAPGNINPSSVTVEAAMRDLGLQVSWHRSHVTISGLAFQHQTDACIHVQDADHVTIDDCAFSDAYRGITSVGNSNNYLNSSFTRLYGTALFALDESANIIGNEFTDVAMVPGSGENSWGYFGIRTTGADIVVRDNRLENIGYIGIEVEHNALVEKNVIINATAILNDGGGIAFDFANGMVIQDNIIRDCVGSLESSAPSSNSYSKICNGIYFGNHGVNNTTVQRNTVLNCKGAGILVDHTMGASGNQIKDNTLFNNDGQLVISDYSNNSGPSAVAPYFIANYNDVYSGNVMYSLTKDQLCMKQTDSYGAQPVNYGTFSNNRYYNPYNEMSIELIIPAMGGSHYFALERWRNAMGQDLGSTRSPLRLNAYATAQELSGNLVQNGEFTSNVAGWTGWPYNAQVDQVTDHLDSGALKAYLPDNSQYNSFGLHNPDLFPMENNAWYRVHCSLQSTVPGDLVIGVKGQSQFTNPNVIWQRQIPFDTERRDLDMYFQSNMSDQSQVQFINQWTEPMYYLDNVEVTKVTVQPLDPAARSRIFVNEQDSPQEFTLPDGCWKGMNDAFLGSTITVPGHSSVVAYKVDGPECGSAAPSGSIRVKVLLGGALNAGDTLMREDLRTAGLIPSTEPYSGMGYVVENADATVTPALLQITGAQAVVDWVLLEIRQYNPTYDVAGRRACLLRRDGTVVTPDGSDLISFNASAVNRYVSVRHRNHLGAMCSALLTAQGQLVDFTLPSTPIYGTDAEKVINGRMALWPGNVAIDSMVKYTGSANDRDGILSLTGGSVPTNVVEGYLDGDVNLDGIVSYSGAHNDRDAVLTTIGGMVTTNTRIEQLP